jgi:hypothetical protein
MSYFRMCVLFCQEENRRFQNLENHPLVTSKKQAVLQAKTCRIHSVSFLEPLAQRPKVPQYDHSRNGRYG